MEVSGQLCAPPALNPGKSPWYPPDRRLGGTQSWSRNSCPDQEMNPGLPVHSSTTTLTQLPQSYKVHYGKFTLSQRYA